MPEGPELRMNSLFINNICSGRIFTGQPIKSSVSKNPEIEWDSAKYTITSEARGKELALLLCCEQRANTIMRILFRFGMSGKFVFTKADSIPKHAHLQFYTAPRSQKEEREVLSFVDVRRFGSWHVMEGWGEGRGPDFLNEYGQFRANVLDNLEDVAFNRPICEAMLNQKYFNGIGNYLRAEILYRAKIAPFTCARSVLEPLTQDLVSPSTDVLSLCRDVSQEVVQLKTDLGKAEKMTVSVSEEDHTAFLQWLRCYNNPDMSIMKDKNGRTIWFQGPPGPMAPKSGKIKAPKRRRAPDNPNPITTTSSTQSQDSKEKMENLKAKKRKVVKTEQDERLKVKGKTQRIKKESSLHLVIPRRSARLVLRDSKRK